MGGAAAMKCPEEWSMKEMPMPSDCYSILIFGIIYITLTIHIHCISAQGTPCSTIRAVGKAG